MRLKERPSFRWLFNKGLRMHCSPHLAHWRHTLFPSNLSELFSYSCKLPITDSGPMKIVSVPFFASRSAASFPSMPVTWNPVRHILLFFPDYLRRLMQFQTNLEVILIECSAFMGAWRSLITIMILFAIILVYKWKHSCLCWCVVLIG